MESAWGPLRSETQFWKDDNHGFIAKPCGIFPSSTRDGRAVYV